MNKEIKIIGGPCSLQSSEQLTFMAQIAAETRTHLRAGIVKPRTKPNGFEGLGFANGLTIVRDVLSQYPGIEFNTEVWYPDHVRSIAALIASNPDLLINLWIGARTGPGNIAGDIASTIKDYLPEQTTLTVKNHIGGEEAWRSNLDYAIHRLGSRRVIAMMRGVPPSTSVYRNQPNLDLCCAIQDDYDIPIGIDPSHIAGYSPENVDLVTGDLMQKSASLSARRGKRLVDIVMLEATPGDSLTDSQQALSPSHYIALISKIRSLAS